HSRTPGLSYYSTLGGSAPARLFDHQLFHPALDLGLLDPRLAAAAQDRVALVQRALIDRRWVQPVLLAHLAALAVGVERVLIADQADVLLRDAALQGELRGLGHAERLGDAPVARRVDDDPLGPVLAHDLDHARVAHLGA